MKHEHKWIYKEVVNDEYFYKCECGDKLVYDSWDTLSMRLIRREEVKEKDENTNKR